MNYDGECEHDLGGALAEAREVADQAGERQMAFTDHDGHSYLIVFLTDEAEEN